MIFMIERECPTVTAFIDVSFWSKAAISQDRLDTCAASCNWQQWTNVDLDQLARKLA
jgi:hypothetical protein